MVTRYVCTSDGQDMWGDETGDFVEYEDYAKLAETNRELLEALNSVISAIDHGTQMDVINAVDDGRTAITKALGKQNERDD